MAQAPPPSQSQIEAAHRRPDAAPPTRPDGRCLTCLGERPPLAVAHDDPWCSGECSRRYWGTELPATHPGVRQ